MPRAVRALLVGIDAYPPPVPALRGCVHDVRAAEAVLRARAAAEGAELAALTLTDAAATRDAVVAAFRTHLAAARAGDAAVFYFSGHGSQQPCAPELAHLEPDGLDETLVCHDSRAPGRYDLADKELGGLLAEVAAGGAHVLVVLDCCHAGSGTRADGAVRRAPADARPRPADSYAAAPAAEARLTPAAAAPAAGPAPPAGRVRPRDGDWVPAPSADAVVLAACRSDQRAREVDFDGVRRGVFSYYLLDALAGAGGAVPYGTLFRRVKAMVERRTGPGAERQSPEIEWGSAEVLGRGFLGLPAAPPAGGAPFVLRHDPALGGWAIDGGAVHGVAPPTPGGGATVLAVRALDADPRAPRPAAPLATARVVEVLPAESRVAVDAPAALDPARAYEAAVVAVPLPAARVRLVGDARGAARVRAALAAAGPGGGPSPHVRLADDADAELLVEARADGFAVTRRGDGAAAGGAVVAAVAAAVPEADDAAALAVVRALEHAARWLAVARLANPGSALAADALAFEAYRVTGASRMRDPVHAPVERWAGPGPLRLTHAAGGPRPAVKFRLVNRGDEALTCALLVLTDAYAVDATALFAGGTVRLAPGEAAWARQGAPYAVPADGDAAECARRVKLVVSTRAFDALAYAQGPLAPGPAAGAPEASAARAHAAFATLGAPGRMRDIGGEEAAPADWRTAELTVVTVRA